MDVHDSTLFEFYSAVQGYVFSPAFAGRFDALSKDAQKALIEEHFIPFTSKLKENSLSPILDSSNALHEILLRFEVFMLGKDFPLHDLYLIPKTQFHWQELLGRETSELLDDLGFLLRIYGSFSWDMYFPLSEIKTGGFSPDIPLQGAGKAGT